MRREEESLFRKEVIEAKGMQTAGALSLAQPVSGWLLAAVSLVLATSIIAFVSFGTITRKARISGLTTPPGGALSVSAPSIGVLTDSFTSEGQQVRPGQVLFELSTGRQATTDEVGILVAQQLAIRQNSLESEIRARRLQDQARKKSIEERILNLQAELMQLDQDVTLAERKRELAEQSLKRFETLSVNGYVSPANVQQKQEELIDQRARISSLIGNKARLRANLGAMKTELLEAESDSASGFAQFERAHASLRQEIVENDARSKVLIRAPRAGIIATIASKPGQSISSGQVLATLIPDAGAKEASLEVHLYAPSRTAGFVSAGQKVLIRFHAFPYQKFGLYEGEIVDISRTPLAPNELPSNLASTILSTAQQTIVGSNSSEALYRIRVRPKLQELKIYGAPQKLKPGMTLDADILQEERKIWEWIFEPLLAI